MSWLQATIGDVCLPTGQRDPSRNGGGTFRYVDIAGIDRESKRVARAEAIPCSDAPSRARKEIKVGDVLVSTVRPNLNAIAQIPEDLDGEIASTGFAVLRANPKLVEPRYLFYRAQHQEFVDYLVANATGASYPAVSDSIVRRAALPLPPPKEQSRIVELLDQADRLRRLRREADTKAARILPSLFERTFGKPFHDSRWPVLPLGELLNIMRNGTTADQNTNGKGYPVTRIETISAGVINPRRVRYLDITREEAARWLLQKGDILFSHINSETHIGKTAIYHGTPELLVHGMNLLLLRPDTSKIEPTYLFALLNTPEVRTFYRNRCKRAVNQASLNQKDIGALPVPLPPLEAQRSFSALSLQIEGVLGNESVAAEKLDELFELMLRQAFSGQLTAEWRAAHMQELLAEMAQQARALNLPLPKELEALP